MKDQNPSSIEVTTKKYLFTREYEIKYKNIGETKDNAEKVVVKQWGDIVKFFQKIQELQTNLQLQYPNFIKS